jgi:hypothetical protein
MRSHFLKILAVMALGGASLVATSSSALGSSVAGITTTSLGTTSPTFVGSAATGCVSGCNLLTGPNVVPAVSSLTTAPATGTADHPITATGGPDTPQPIPFRSLKKHGGPGVAPPLVTCQSTGACSPANLTAGGAVGVKGLNAVDSATANFNAGGPGIDIEPSDQGLCAGNGYVVESDNIGEVQVFNTGLNRVGSVVSLDSLMGLSTLPAFDGTGWSSGGDISCVYDPSNGGHWFITQIVSASTEAGTATNGPGPFGGCFAGVAYTCYEGIAVSQTNDPTGPYNVYFLNANYNPSASTGPGPAGTLLNDFAKIATSQDAFLLFYDEFPLYGGFNGAQEFAFNKTAMETGVAATDPTFNVAIENMGTLNTPDGVCASGQGPGPCWFSVIPVEPPDAAAWDNSFGGSAFMLGALDFNGLGDSRVAAFDWTGLSNLTSSGCSSCSGIQFGGTLFSGTEFYYGEGTNAFNGAQKAGPIPLGSNCQAAGLLAGKAKGNPNHGGLASCPEGPIATNGDNFTQASQANGELWTSLSTAVAQNYKGTSQNSEVHQGVAWWEVGTSAFDSGGSLTLDSQGYVSAAHEDLEMSSVAAGDNGSVLLDFTLSGNGGPGHVDGGGFFPSTAWTSLSGGTTGVIHVADLGLAPQDGFSEYQGYSGNVTNPGTRPRWGDYSAAVWSNGAFYFAGQYIQSPNCTSSFTLSIGTCGGTRDGYANWGTSVNSVSY